MTSQPTSTGSCPFPHAAAAPEAACPAGPARRSFLGAALGVGAAGAALAGGAFALGGGSQPAEAADAGAADGVVPFHGEHQAGVLTPQPMAAAFLSFDVIAQDRPALEQLFHTLTERIRFLTAGGTRRTWASARRRPTTGSSAPPCPATT